MGIVNRDETLYMATGFDNTRLQAKSSVYTVRGLCSLFGVSKQAYYKHNDDCIEKASHARFIVECVQSIRSVDKAIGGEKLWYMYRAYFGKEYSLGHDSFVKVLKRYGLTLRKPRKGCRTSNSEHGVPLYPDLIKELAVVCPNQFWVSDITYIRLLAGFCYLSLITDAYTHEIISYYAELHWKRYIP